MPEHVYRCGCTHSITCSTCQRHIHETGAKMDAQFVPDAPARVRLYDVEGEDADYAADRWDNDRMRGPDGGW